MKKLLVIAILMLALVFTVVACDKTPDATDTTVADTTVETPTEAPTDPVADPTEAPTDPVADPTEAPTDPVEDPTEAPTTAKPEAPTEPPATEAPTADPMEPTLLIEPDAILQGATGAGANNVGVGEVTTEGNRTFLRLSSVGGDPYFTLLNGAGKQPNYLAISYRTDSPLPGEIFIGSGGGANGQGDHFAVEWVHDGTWNLMIIDLTATGVTSIQDGVINFVRLDFFTDHVADKYMDIQYVGFFNTAQAAEAYDFKVNPPYIEAADPAAGKIGHSFDTFYVNGQMYFPEDGGAGDKLTAQNNTISFEIGEAHDSMVLRGWIGFGQAIDSFGYYLDNYKMVFNPDFAKATEAGVLAAGGEFASRFEIMVPLSGLLSGDHMAGFVVKLADGTVVRLRDDIIVDLTDDVTYTFVSNVASNDEGTDLQGSDLTNYFTVNYGAGDPHAVNNGLYVYGGINEMYSDVDGLYAYSVNFADAATAAMMFVRGTRVVHSVDLPAPANGLYPINNYYETDGNNHMGGAGVYANLTGSRLNIYVKVYDDATTTHVALKTYSVAVEEGSELTIADAGDALYFIVGDKLYATIKLAGETSYDKLCDLAEGVTFAKTAVVALPDGTVETIENTLIVATYASDIGVAVRGASMSFSSVKVRALSDVKVPAELYVPVPKKNVAVGAEVTADSVENATNIPSNATDGDPVTRWGALPNGVANLVVDLGEIYDLIGLDVSFENAGWEYEIAISKDGNEYTVIYESARHGAKVISINGNASARYIKFTRLQDDDSTQHWFSIYEVYAYVVDDGAETEPETPAGPQNTVIDLSTVAGYKSTNNFGYDCPIVEIGYNEVYLLGDIDLSQYSEIIIKYSYDGDSPNVTDRTPEQCWADCGHAPIIGFTSINKCFGYANVTNQDAIDAGVYADMPHTPGNWAAATRTATIDISNVDYNGPCYLSAYNPWGRTIAVASIVLVPKA